MNYNYNEQKDKIVLSLVRSGVHSNSALIKAMSVPKATLFARLQRLERDGYLTHITGKKATLRITAKGLEFVKDVALIREGGTVRVGAVDLISGREQNLYKPNSEFLSAQ